MKYCIIGSGAFGINLSYNLLKKGHYVTLITNKFESVSSIYARGVPITNPPLTWLPNMYFKMDNYNFIWTIMCFILTLVNSLYYIKYKKFAINKSKKIIESYNLKYNTCNNKYFINLPEIFNKMMIDMRKNNKFTINIKNVSNDDIKKLSNKFDLIFDCRGSNVTKNYLCENIGGYKLIIQANNQKKKCFSYEDGWFIHSDINNKNNIIVKGGFIVGSKVYDTKN